MSCRFSRETLALHVEGDLPAAATAATVRHIASVRRMSGLSRGAARQSSAHEIGASRDGQPVGLQGDAP